MITLPDKETESDAKKLFEWIETNIFYPGNGYFGDWRMEWAESQKYLKLKVKRGDEFKTNPPISPKLWYFHVSYQFLDIHGEITVMTYEQRHEPKIHNRNVYGGIHSDLAAKFEVIP